MPAYGGIAPYPRRMGGGPSLVRVIMEALSAGRGSAYSTDPDSAVMTENLAFAREIAAAYEANQRLTNQFDPARMTEAIPRWSKILKIVVPSNATDHVKRQAIAAVFARTGNDVLRTYIEPLLIAALGDVYIDIEYIPYDEASITTTPGLMWPWGVTNTLVPWSSTVAHILVKLQKLTGMTEGQFYEAAGRVRQVLDGTLPAWVTFDWYREPETGTPIAIADGPTGLGFYCDEMNLDNCPLSE